MKKRRHSRAHSFQAPSAAMSTSTASAPSLIGSESSITGSPGKSSQVNMQVGQSDQSITVILHCSACGEQEGGDVGETSPQEVTIQAPSLFPDEGVDSPHEPPHKRRRRRGGQRNAAKKAKKQGGTQEPIPPGSPSPGGSKPLPNVKAFHKTHRKGKDEGHTRHHVGWSRNTIPTDDK